MQKKNAVFQNARLKGLLREKSLLLHFVMLALILSWIFGTSYLKGWALDLKVHVAIFSPTDVHECDDGDK